jgi:hypothetical protein
MITPVALTRRWARTGSAEVRGAAGRAGAAWLLSQYPRGNIAISCIDIAKSGFPCAPMIISLECQALNNASSFIH